LRHVGRSQNSAFFFSRASQSYTYHPKRLLLEYHIQHDDNWHHVIRVSIPADTVKPQLDAKYATLKNIRIEGFRKGKVPMQLVKKMYGKQVEADVFQPIIQEAFQTIFKENEFDLLSQPELQDIQFDEKSGLTFAFHFDVRPIIFVRDYRGLAVERLLIEVTEADVEQTLENMRRQNAMVHNVEEGAQVGHFVIADLQETDLSGLPILGRRQEDRVLELKEGEAITEQLLGIKAGEERRLQITYSQPAESSLVEAPKPEQMFFRVSAKEVKERRLPDLDDEFAKDMGEYEDLTALKNAVRQRLQYQAHSESVTLFRRALEDELIKRNPVQPPSSMMEKYMNALVEDARRHDAKLKEEEIRQLFRPSAVRNIAWILLREQLIKDEVIEVTDEEMEERFRLIAAGGEAGEKRVQELRNNKEALERLRDAMEEEKVHDLLAREASVTDIRTTWGEHQKERSQREQELTENEE